MVWVCYIVILYQLVLRIAYTYVIIHELILHFLAPIYLINANPSISALIGNAITMHVSSLGLGRHTYQWTRRRPNVNIKEDAIGVNTVQLTLPNVTLEDAGRYIFNARSQWSSNRTRVDLSVTCKLISLSVNIKYSYIFIMGS